MIYTEWLAVYADGMGRVGFLLEGKTVTLAACFLCLETPGLPDCYPLTPTSALCQQAPVYADTRLWRPSSP